VITDFISLFADPASIHFAIETNIQDNRGDMRTMPIIVSMIKSRMFSVVDEAESFVSVAVTIRSIRVEIDAGIQYGNLDGSFAFSD
jgi:hypothetical protein